MCQLAVRGEPRLAVSGVELERDGPSYTIDTVRRLRADGWPAVHWLIGADVVATLPSWREPEALLREAKLVVVARPGWPVNWDAMPEPFRALRDNVVEAPLIPVSATEVRRRVAAGEPIDDLVPPAVAGYIAERGLYR